MSEDIVIGYWGHKDGGDNLPRPMANTARPDQAKIIAKLKVAMDSGYLNYYRGASECRLCGQQNGYKELEIIRGRTKYRIPDGYLHYLEDHQVGYDPMLLEALDGWKTP